MSLPSIYRALGLIARLSLTGTANAINNLG